MKAIKQVLFLIIPFLIGCSSVESTGDYSRYINDDWVLISSEAVTDASSLSELQQVVELGGHGVTLPATVLSGLIQNGFYPDIYYSNNIDTVSAEPFEKSWWYFKEFSIDEWNAEEYYALTFEGINYQANIWLNGQLVADADLAEGPFRIFNLDITPYAQAENLLAVEVIPPKFNSLTIGFVDWNPEAPDKNMGLWRGVGLHRSGQVSIESVGITSQLDLEGFSYADLHLDVELKNHAKDAVKGKLNIQIEEGVKLSANYALEAGETKRVVLTTEDYGKLRINNPRVWWPHDMGTPELYFADVSVSVDGKVSHAVKERFGIREVSDYTFEINNLTHRGYKINGRNVLLRGGGWVDDNLLADSDAKVRHQVQYVKDMNMNLIRLEGFWGNSKELYNACAEEGVLLMIGLSCQWEWEEYSGRPEYEKFMSVDTDHDIAMISQSYQDQVKWDLNNPSIVLWVFGSDKLPIPKFEESLMTHIREYDKHRPTLTSCQNVSSEVSGPSGAKMFGPYEYVPPVYWYNDTRFGGAYGFNTETGPGAQIPPIESIRRMLKPEDVPLVNQEGWQFHSGRNEFQELDLFLLNYYNRYWKDENIEDFAFNVQMSNYEAVRAMFEAFVVKRNDGATGVVQWMLNSAWPEMVWQLYDWYMNPNGAYFGTKKANQTVNLIYNYGDKGVYLSNMKLEKEQLKAEIKLYDIHSNVVFEQEAVVAAAAESVEKLLDLPHDKVDSEVYFLSMRLMDQAGNEVADNFYWLSAQEDEPEYDKSNWYYTPNKGYASFTELKAAQEAEVEATWSVVEGGATVELTNKSDHLAFFIEMRIADQAGATVLPVMWSDNYVTLLPGETRTYQATFNEGKDAAPHQLEIKGFNVVEAQLMR